MKKVLIFVRSLNAGGAERQVVVMAKGLSARGYGVTVLTFYEGGFYASELLNTNVELLSLGKKGRWDLVSSFRLVKVLRNQRPEVIYSLMGVANILAVLVRPFIKPTKIVWGIRASNMDLGKYDWLHRLAYQVEIRLARFPDLIISNSGAGRSYAIENGFPENKITVIPNGIDTAGFYPDKLAGALLRKIWGIAEDEFLIGLIGRVDPMKGHSMFFEAAAMIRRQHSRVRFVCVGSGRPEYENAMRELASEHGLDDVLVWAGRQVNMFAVYNAIDAVSLCSPYGEGFSNALGEAMACGTPCVATNVGDSAFLVGETGLIVPVKNPKVLCEAWRTVLLYDYSKLKQIGEQARKRIVSRFSVDALLNATEKVLHEF